MITKIGTSQFGKTDYLVDTAAEVKDLPTKDGVGSCALCVEDSKVYILNGTREWIELGISSNG